MPKTLSDIDIYESACTLKLKIVKLNPEAVAPQRATAGSAGWDLSACSDYTIALRPDGGTALVNTGIAIELPEGYEGQIRPRSGLASKHGITVLNSPGTIDPDYRGELKVPLINHSHQTFKIHPGMRIAQLVIAPVATVEMVEVTELAPYTCNDVSGLKVRGERGFGHSGLERKEGE